MRPSSTGGGDEPRAPAAPEPGRGPRWRALLRRELVLVIVVGALLVAAIAIYLVTTGTAVRTLYELP